MRAFSAAQVAHMREQKAEVLELPPSAGFHQLNEAQRVHAFQRLRIGFA